jgi:hypothetical protein
MGPRRLATPEGTGARRLAPGEGSGPRRLAPGKGPGLASWRPEGTGPRKLSPRTRDRAPQAGARTKDRPSRPRPGQAVAVAETARGAGSGGILAGVGREGHGSVTGVGSRHGERGKPTLRRVLVKCHDRVVDFGVPIGGQKSTTRFRVLPSGPEYGRRHPESVDFPASSAPLRAGVPSLARGGDVSPTSLRPDARSPRNPSVPGVSWRPQPARAATGRPGRSSDGRRGLSPRPSLPHPEPTS